MLVLPGMFSKQEEMRYWSKSTTFQLCKMNKFWRCNVQPSEIISSVVYLKIANKQMLNVSTTHKKKEKEKRMLYLCKEMDVNQFDCDHFTMYMVYIQKNIKFIPKKKNS